MKFHYFLKNLNSLEDLKHLCGLAKEREVCRGLIRYIYKVAED